jgi:hypothetical protein
MLPATGELGADCAAANIGTDNAAAMDRLRIDLRIEKISLEVEIGRDVAY